METLVTELIEALVTQIQIKWRHGHVNQESFSMQVLIEI